MPINNINYRYPYKSHKKRKNHNNKLIVVLVCMLLVINIVIFGALYLFKWRNNAVDTSNTVTNSNGIVTSFRISSFPMLSQGEEMPSGCEITSLTMTLNYYDIPADKFDLADNYLKKGEVGTVNFREAFVGDPRDSSSYGCYAPVIVDTANNYLKTNNFNMTAKDLTGTEFDSLMTYVNNNTPVIVWGTRDCKAPKYTTTWNIDGEDLTWIHPEHCMVLIGYDEQYVWVADPIYGYEVAYDRADFTDRYDFLGKQAVIIQ